MKFKIGEHVIHTDCQAPRAVEIINISDGKYWTGSNEYFNVHQEDKLRLATPAEILGIPETKKPNKTISKREIRNLMKEAWRVGFNLKTEDRPITPGDDVDEILEKFFKNKLK